MSDMTDNVLRKVRSLPPLDQSVMKIQQICADADSSVMDLAKVVESDPMLTANILKATNSPIYGFTKEITNVNQAVSLFGMATIRGFALAATVKKSMKIDLKPYGLTETNFVTASVNQSALMLNWYKKVSRPMLDVLVPAAFLMELGKVIIANIIQEAGKTDEFSAKIKEAKNEEQISSIEKEFVGVCNEEVTSKIFEKWNFEKIMIDAIRNSDDYTSADDEHKSYALALQIVKNTVSSNFPFIEENIAKATELVAQNKLKEYDFEDAIDKVKSGS
jgi:HD-like signal output (HDOD) protein